MASPEFSFFSVLGCWIYGISLLTSYFTQAERTPKVILGVLILITISLGAYIMIEPFSVMMKTFPTK